MIQHNFFLPLYKIMLTDKEFSKLLECIMIKSSMNLKIIIILCSTNSKIDVLNEFDI